MQFIKVSFIQYLFSFLKLHTGNAQDQRALFKKTPTQTLYSESSTEEEMYALFLCHLICEMETPVA